MPSSRFDEERDYAFADQALALRKRAGLTQSEVGALLDVSTHSIHAWEAGLSYPASERLKALIALYLQRGAFGAGREEEEAATLWATVRAKAARRTVPFDASWFAELPHRAGGDRPAPVVAVGSWQDWGDAPAVPVVQGRGEELAMLAGWMRDEGCRVVQILGVGGIGKTTLAVQLAHNLAPSVAVVYWRSLRNALPAEEWLAGAVGALSVGEAALPEGLDARLGLLVRLLRTRRALLVLDNLEAVLEPGAQAVSYRAGLAGFGTVLARLAESAHHGCLLLTSREQPLPPDGAAVRALHLTGLNVAECRALLARRKLEGDDTTWRALVARYAGNPLALSIVAETIGVVFGGDIAAFLAQDVAVFGGIRQLLDAQVGRLSALEQAVLTWLAVEREPVGFAALVADLGPAVPRADAVEAVEALQRRSLAEWGTGGAFTVQPVVLEYITARLVDSLAREILAGEPALLARQPLLKATAKDYVRRSQERLIAQPLLDRLSGSLGRVEAVADVLLALLGRWRGRAVAEQGYGPGNVLNLLRLLRGDLRGLDLSALSIRHAYLQDVDVQDTSLARAHLSEVILSEAFNYPTSVAFSADGTYLAAGIDTGELNMWRVPDRTLLVSAPGHSGPLLGVALDAEGHLVASGSFDGTVKLWEALTGGLLTTLEGHSGGVWGVALSADGRLVATGGSQDGTVKLWAARRGELLTTLDGHSGGVQGVALSADGQVVASGSFDGTIKVWHAPAGTASTGRLQATLQGHTAPVRSVALSADGRVVASGSQDGTVKLWEAPAGRSGREPSARLLTTFHGHSGGVLSVALSGDGRLVASGSQDGTVRLWQAPSESEPAGRLQATLQGHTRGIEDVALSADGRLVASGSQDGTIRFWEAPTGRLLGILQGYLSAVWDVVLSREGDLVASGSVDGTVKLWEAPTGVLLATLRGHTSAVTAVALSGDGRLVASGSFDGTVKLWEPATGQLLSTLQGHTGGVLGVALSGDGRVVASGSFDGTVKLWEAATGLLLGTLQGHLSGVHRVALSGDGQMVASGSFDGTVRLWEAAAATGPVRSEPLRATLQGHIGGVWGVALSGDGQVVASGSQDGTVKLWEASTGRLRVTLDEHTSTVWSVALSMDGQVVASGSRDGTVKLWDTKSGRLLGTLKGHTNAVRGVSLSGNGQVLASCGYDGTVKLWETHNGTCLFTLRSDRRYERLDITGLTGVTEAQRVALLALGAIDRDAVVSR